MNDTNTIDTPIGRLGVMLKGDKLCALSIGRDVQSADIDNMPLFRQLRAEMTDYFTKKQFCFSVPFELHGTAFQKRVWQALNKIPAGKTLTYGQLAEQLNSSPRAIGNACRANPLPIIIPCHRVIAKQGLGGYDGQTDGERLDIKRWLLRHEGASID